MLKSFRYMIFLNQCVTPLILSPGADQTAPHWPHVANWWTRQVAPTESMVAPGSHTSRDAIFCMHTHITSRNNVGYVNLTSEVKGGHWRSILRGHCRSKIANWGHSLMKTLRDAICCMYTLIVSIGIWDCNILTSEVIRGHRSKTSK